MNTINDRQHKFVGFPFYIFITLILGIIGVFGFNASWKAGQPALAILGVIFFIAHIGLYWLNSRRFYRPRWQVFYYIAQTFLIIAITSLPFGLNFLGTAVISITAEALGLWGNSRRAFFLGLFYVSILLVTFFIRADPDHVIEYLAQFLVNGGFIVVIMIVFNQQLMERQKAEDLAETLESANAKLAAYAARNESLTLQAERERMARELHDTLAQGVAGLILQLEAITAYQQQERYAQAESGIEKALSRARNTLRESRAAIEDLRNEEVDFETAVSQSIAQFNATGGTTHELTINLTAVSLPQHIQHHARRVLYEALTNIQKHAQAKTAHVFINQSTTALTLTVQDDGVGFDPQQAPAHGHFGLRGLQERAELTGSQYTLTSTPQEGTTIEFIFPLNAIGQK